MKKITLKDIAAELNVTVGTVSHVLNGIDDISEETKQRVLEAAHRLGYISNGPAASLRSGKTHTIAIIIPDISNPHIAYQVKLIEDRLKERDYSVIILNTNEDEQIEHKAIVTACGKQVDGILLCPCQHSPKNIEFLNKLGIPFALIGRFFSGIHTDYICADDVKGGYLAGKFLVEKGCRNPVYIGAYKYIEGSTHRFCGLKKAFEEAGICLREDQFIQISPKSDGAKALIQELRAQGQTFDSVVAYSDVLAFELMVQVNVKCRTQIPVIGFDAINTRLVMPFPYVSVGMVGSGWANKATEILLNKIGGAAGTCQEIIDVELFQFNC